jgi:hypothetical protein
MDFAWLEQANDKFDAEIALHFKQYGHARNNPAVREIMRGPANSRRGANFRS